MSNKALADGVDAIAERATQMDRLRKEAESHLTAIKPLLLGRRVKTHYGVYSITSADLGWDCRITIHGRKLLAGSGELGSKSWDIGMLRPGTLIEEPK